MDVGDKEFPAAQEQVGMGVSVVQFAVVDVLIRDRETLITGPESKSVVEEFSEIHIEGGTVSAVGEFTGDIFLSVKTNIQSTGSSDEPIGWTLVLGGCHDCDGRRGDNHEYSFHCHCLN